jgi:hypothetical protein
MEENYMGCCGQSRQAWREWKTTAGRTSSPPPPAVLQNPTILYHLGEYSLVIKGEATGRTYLFAGRDAGLTVDERDVPALLATGWFVASPPEK